MAKFSVTINVIYRKTLSIYAPSEEEAGEKAVEMAAGWQNVHDAEVVEVQED